MIRSRLILKTITATAGNVATTSITPVNEVKLYIVETYITLVCDGTVATRTLIIGPTTGATVQGVQVDITATAGQTKTLSTNDTLKYTNAAGFWGSDAQAGIGWFIPYGQMLRISVNNGVAGDSYSGYVKYLEVPA